jgi:hypothetical protein
VAPDEALDAMNGSDQLRERGEKSTGERYRAMTSARG